MLSNIHLISDYYEKAFNNRVSILVKGVNRRETLWNYISEVYEAVSAGRSYEDGRMLPAQTFEFNNLASGELGALNGNPQGAVLKALEQTQSSTLDRIPQHDTMEHIEEARATYQSNKGAQLSHLLSTLTNGNSLTTEIDNISVSLDATGTNLVFEERDEEQFPQVAQDRKDFVSGLNVQHGRERNRGLPEAVEVTSGKEVKPNKRQSMRKEETESLETMLEAEEARKQIEEGENEAPDPTVTGKPAEQGKKFAKVKG